MKNRGTMAPSKAPGEYQSTSVALIKNSRFDEVHEMLNKKFGFELSRSQAVEYLVTTYLDINAKQP